MRVNAAPQTTIDDPRAGEFQLFPNPRVAWDSPVNAWTGFLRARRREGRPFLDLTLSNPTEAGLPEIRDALRDVFGAMDASRYQPQPEGSLAAREAVAAWYRNRAGRAPDLNLPVDRILLTASSSESYSFLFQALCAPGDEVLAPLPSYPLFEYLAGLAAVKLGSYRLRYSGEWCVDFASLAAAVTPRTRAIVVVNPNNPTGNFLRSEERTRLLEFCAERRLVLIADEVFEEYAVKENLPGSPRVSFASPQDCALCVSLSGLSKAAGLPQMKVGWMILQGPEKAVRVLRERLLLVADTYLSVSAPVQAALPGLLRVGLGQGDAIRERVRANAAALQQLGANAPHLTALPPEGGWNAVLRLPAILSDSAWCEALLSDADVLIQPGFLYDFEGEAWVVLSLLPEESVFEQAVHRLGEHVEAAVRGAMP